MSAYVALVVGMSTHTCTSNRFFCLFTRHSCVIHSQATVHLVLHEHRYHYFFALFVIIITVSYSTTNNVPQALYIQVYTNN